jgi:hypothetical protein
MPEARSKRSAPAMRATSLRSISATSIAGRGARPARSRAVRASRMPVLDGSLRHLLARHFTATYSAREVALTPDLARAEAERIHLPPARNPFPGPRQPQKFRRPVLPEAHRGTPRTPAHSVPKPTQLGPLERFHKTLHRRPSAPGLAMAA